jgi:hypothetical protein
MLVLAYTHDQSQAPVPQLQPSSFIARRLQAPLLRNCVLRMAGGGPVSRNRQQQWDRRASDAVRRADDRDVSLDGESLDGQVYRALWSRDQKAAQLQVSNDGLSVFNPSFFESLESDIIFEAWSVRADTPLPRSGQHFFEVSISQEDKPEGLPADTLEEGWNTVGLVGVQVCLPKP